MSISFQLKEGENMIEGVKRKVLYFEVISDSLVVAREEILDWDSAYNFRSLLRVVEENLEDVYSL